MPGLGDDFRAELIAAVEWIVEGPEVWPISVDDPRVTGWVGIAPPLRFRAGFAAATDARDHPVAAGEDLTGHLVSVTVSQRAAEANLAVAHVADETSASLIHVIA